MPLPLSGPAPSDEIQFNDLPRHHVRRVQPPTQRGTRDPHLRFMLERYGEGAVAELEGLKKGTGKVTDEELREELERLRALA
jgi:hypothetical protein